jgi:hypothetical protein
MPETITITKDQLKAVMQAWEQDHRDGKCISYEESNAKPLEQVAQENTDMLWNALK